MRKLLGLALAFHAAIQFLALRVGELPDEGP